MKKGMIFGLILLAGATFIGCNGSDIFGPSNKSSLGFRVDANNCLIDASDYDSTSEFNSGNYRSKTFVWHCTEFKGQDEVYVSLSFDNNSDGSQCLKLDSEFVADGICL